ncbi:sensor histidine kinase [Flavobacterium sp. RHBU_24]|uniref:sensor histidine kinase n=1 Tax=Flavobacterium sp. RHBU_24 TaxID=3391185 RepID=UPI0039849A41
MGTSYNVRYNKIALLAAMITLTAGAVVMVGWLAEIEALKSICPNFVSMKFNTALCFILLAVALVIELKRGRRKNKVVPKILASIVGLYGLLSFAQVFGFNFAIDELFIKDTVAAFKGEHSPGRMSPLTAVCFLFSSLALLLIKSGGKNARKLYQLLLHVVTLVASVAFLGYLFSIPNLYSYSFANSMALHTSVLFILFSCGAAFIHPNTGIVGLLTGKEIGNIMARKLTVSIVPTVLILGFLRAGFTSASIVPDELGITLLCISFLIICFICIWITSKALNKIALKGQQMQENFRVSIEASPYALILSNREGEIIHVNNKTARLFGYTKEELIGSMTKIITPEELRRDERIRSEHFFLNQNTLHYGANDEIYCQTKKGNKFPVEIIITPVKTSEGTLALSSIVDITERKRSEQIMQDQLRELQQKNQEMEQFSFIASHDLQEPLRTVSNYIMLLEEDYPEQINGEVKEHLGNINEAVDRMKKLIRNLLDFSRLGRDKTLVSTDIQAILAEVLADLQSLIRESNAIVIYNPEELPTLYAYDTELRMLFQNLLNNAVKFSKKNIPPEISIHCRLIDGYYEFAVRDNGIGINKKHIINIFNIFQRIHGNDEYQGYGIGLAHCKKIAEMHGGKIWAESEPGEGSTFKFTILNLKL